MNWYYARGDERMGPVDDAAMDQLVRSGAVTAETLVWKEGMADWQPLGSVAQVGSPAPAPSPTPVAAGDMAMPESLYGEQTVAGCVECGRSFPQDEMVPYEDHLVCAACKDVFFQRVREGGGLRGAFRYAGFWVRVGARIVDGFIINIATLAISFVVGFVGALINSAAGGGDGFEAIAGILGGLIGIILPIVYEIVFVGKYGATPGKMSLGIKVVRSDGSPVSYGRATGRMFSTWLSYIIFLIGFIMAAFDDEKRTLHDRICDTRVIYK